MTPVIEKGIPMPAGSFRAPARFAFRAVFKRMRVGDSFAVPASQRLALARAANNFHVVTGKRIEMRRLDMDTVRCWRTA